MHLQIGHALACARTAKVAVGRPARLALKFRHLVVTMLTPSACFSSLFHLDEGFIWLECVVTNMA